MNKSIQKQNKKAMRQGMSPAEIIRMREIARRETARMEEVAVEKAFLRDLSIPLIILFEDYWKKTAHKKAPKFIEDVMSLFESVRMGIVTDEQLKDALYDLSGVKIEAEWMGERNTCKNCMLRNGCKIKEDYDISFCSKYERGLSDEQTKGKDG